MTTTDPTIDEKTELAKERNREAADRTLMAWIRTNLSLLILEQASKPGLAA